MKASIDFALVHASGWCGSDKSCRSPESTLWCLYSFEEANRKMKDRKRESRGRDVSELSRVQSFMGGPLLPAQRAMRVPSQGQRPWEQFVIGILAPTGQSFV